MNESGLNNTLRAILTIPLITPSDNQKNINRPFINPKIADTSLFSMDEFLEMHDDRWHDGVLDPLTENNIPAENFTQALLSEIPTQLQDLINENRFHYSYPRGGILIGLSQIAVTALEFWRSNNSLDPSFLVIHLECNNGPSNKQALESFANLNSKYLNKFLNNFFENLDDSSKEVSSLVLRISRKGMLILNFSHENNRASTQNGILVIESEDMATFEPRLKSRFVFLSLIIGIQRYSVDLFKSDWPLLEQLNRKDSLRLRSKINAFSNKWVWPRISTDDYFNLAYKQWQESFSITEYLKNFKGELDEYVELKILQSSDRIENLLITVAVLGIIPTWLGLFDKLSQRVSVGSVFISVFMLFMIWYRKKSR
jgi:hypothetical protein